MWLVRGGSVAQLTRSHYGVQQRYTPGSSVLVANKRPGPFDCVGRRHSIIGDRRAVRYQRSGMSRKRVRSVKFAKFAGKALRSSLSSTWIR